jgi:phage gpG-like protein
MAKAKKKITVHGIGKTRLYFANMVRRSVNFHSELRWARNEIRKANLSNFATQGLTSGAAWNQLDTEYQSWKIAHYGSLPTMIREGDLFRQLTTLSGRVNHVGMRSATFGTNLDYARFHQHGTRFMPARKIVFVPKGFARELGEKVGEYLVYGNEGSQAYRRVKAMVFD